MDSKRYLPGSIIGGNTGSTENHGRSTATERSTTTKRSTEAERKTATKRSTEAERKTAVISEVSGKATAGDGQTSAIAEGVGDTRKEGMKGKQLKHRFIHKDFRVKQNPWKPHRKAVAFMLALLLIITATGPYAEAVTDDGSRPLFIVPNEDQLVNNTQDETGVSDDAAQFFTGTFLLTRLLSSRSSGWNMSLFSDMELLQRVWHALSQMVQNGEIDPETTMTVQETSQRTRRSSDSSRVVDPEPSDNDPSPGNPGENDSEDPGDDTEDPWEPTPTHPGEDPENPGGIDPGAGNGNEGNEPGSGEGGGTGGDEGNDGGSDGPGESEPDTEINDLTLALNIVGEGTVTMNVYGEDVLVTAKHVVWDLAEGSQLTLTASPCDNYTFLGWSHTDDPESFLSTELTFIMNDIQENANITAYFEPLFTVNFTTVEGGLAKMRGDYSSNVFKTGDLVRVIAEEHELFAFSHWSFADEGEHPLSTDVEYSFTMPASHITLIAHFEMIHPFEGGTGKSGNPYRIKSAEQLAVLTGDDPQLESAYEVYGLETNLMKAHYLLLNDIDLKNVIWSPIGASGATPAGSKAFTGTFDGNNKIIKNLTINRPNGSCQAMFHNIGDEASGKKGIVQNLVFLDPNIVAKSHAAVLAVYNHGLVERVQVSTTKITGSPLTPNLSDPANPVVVVGEKTNSGDAYGAGLVVSNGKEGTIIKSGIEAGVLIGGSGDKGFVGLLVAENYGTIDQCFAIGTVGRSLSIDEEQYINHQGGLVGINRNVHSTKASPRIINSYAIVSLEGRGATGRGGLLGFQNSSLNYDDSIGVQYVYAASKPRNQTRTEVGGVIGSGFTKTLFSAYYNKSLIDKPINSLGVGVIENSMKIKETFVGWNFNTIWAVDPTEDKENAINKGYPYLRWQYATE